MSKGVSGAFQGTIGALMALSDILNPNEEEEKLIQAVEDNGDKIDRARLIKIVQRGEDDKIVWLEQGKSGDGGSGLAHIIDRHEIQFNQNGIRTQDISNFLATAIKTGTIVGQQGKKFPADIYSFKYNGSEYYVAITVGSNGYIVSANPASSKRRK
ncbi:MAG: hypothetical protein LUD47_01615 [Clostridia bacterium]|nr:hypothetical protein [Clostridia bacterium]